MKARGKPEKESCICPLRSAYIVVSGYKNVIQECEHCEDDTLILFQASLEPSLQINGENRCDSMS